MFSPTLARSPLSPSLPFIYKFCVLFWKTLHFSHIKPKPISVLAAWSHYCDMNSEKGRVYKAAREQNITRRGTTTPSTIVGLHPPIPNLHVCAFCSCCCKIEGGTKKKTMILLMMVVIDPLNFYACTQTHGVAKKYIHIYIEHMRLWLDICMYIYINNEGRLMYEFEELCIILKVDIIRQMEKAKSFSDNWCGWVWLKIRFVFVAGIIVVWQIIDRIFGAEECQGLRSTYGY